jgi:hypothetical protein
MKKRVKPSLFLTVILPIMLVEILFIIITILSLTYLITAEIAASIILILVSGIIFLITFAVTILIYVLRYFYYENSLHPKGKLNIPCLVGFIMAAAGYLSSALIGWIPIVGIIFSFILAMVIIAGGIVSLVGISIIKKGEKGRGMANIGAFLGIYYLAHLIVTIIIAVLLIVAVSTAVSTV